MKTFRFIGMAIFAVLICVNFVACSSSDDDPTNEKEPTNENTTNQKLISSLTIEKTTFNFTYNEKKQLVSVAKVGGKTNKIEFEWSDSQIVATPTNEWNEIPVCYLLKNGIITSVYNSEGENELTYDKDKHLTKVNDDDTWTWSNGNISKFVHEYNDYKPDTYTYSYYTDKENKHPIVDMSSARLYYAGMLEYDELVFIAHPSLLGKTNKNLIKTRTEGNYTDEYTYELDNNGYPLKIKRNGETAYTIIWK